MRNVSEIRSVEDMRTTTTGHIRSTPPRKDSTYLDVYLLSKEKQRLETELRMLVKRQTRIEGRLGELHEALDKLLEKADHDKRGIPRLREGASDVNQSTDDEGLLKWKNLTVEY